MPEPREDRIPAPPAPDAPPPAPDAPPAPAPAGAREAFQYAVLQAVPSEDRGEALNVGVVLHARRHRFLGVRTLVDRGRLAALDPGLDLDALQAHLDGLVRVAEGDPDAGPVARMDRSDRFGWLVAPSNTIVQPSPVHTGVCEDPRAVLDRLVERLVAQGPAPGGDAPPTGASGGG